MKSLKLFLIALLTCCSQLINAQLDNLSNMSAEWMRLSARNAATDATDIVVYNPAGITSMTNGLHINIGNQSLFRNPSHQYDLGMGQGEQKFQHPTMGGHFLFLPARCWIVCPIRLLAIFRW